MAEYPLVNSVAIKFPLGNKELTAEWKSEYFQRKYFLWLESCSSEDLKSFFGSPNGFYKDPKNFVSKEVKFHMNYTQNQDIKWRSINPNANFSVWQYVKQNVQSRSKYMKEWQQETEEDDLRNASENCLKKISTRKSFYFSNLPNKDRIWRENVSRAKKQYRHHFGDRNDESDDDVDNESEDQVLHYCQIFANDASFDPYDLVKGPKLTIKSRAHSSSFGAVEFDPSVYANLVPFSQNDVTQPQINFESTPQENEIHGEVADISQNQKDCEQIQLDEETLISLGNKAEKELNLWRSKFERIDNAQKIVIRKHAKAVLTRDSILKRREEKINSDTESILGSERNLDEVATPLELSLCSDEGAKGTEPQIQGTEPLVAEAQAPAPNEFGDIVDPRIVDSLQTNVMPEFKRSKSSEPRSFGEFCRENKDSLILSAFADTEICLSGDENIGIVQPRKISPKKKTKASTSSSSKTTCSSTPKVRADGFPRAVRLPVRSWEKDENGIMREYKPEYKSNKHKHKTHAKSPMKHKKSLGQIDEQNDDDEINMENAVFFDGEKEFPIKTKVNNENKVKEKGLISIPQSSSTNGNPSSSREEFHAKPSKSATRGRGKLLAPVLSKRS